MLRNVLAIPKGEWLLQSAAGSELGRMIIRLAKHDGIRTLNVVRRRESVAELHARRGHADSRCPRPDHSLRRAGQLASSHRGNPRSIMFSDLRKV
jgi:NADPH:quinone reductase-like Zn-dependent oxidoreductase